MVKLPTFFKKGIYLLFVLIQTFTILLTPVFSDDISDLESEVDKKNEEVEQKESSLEQVKREIANIKKSSASLDEKIVLMDKELKNIEKYIDSAQAQIEKKEDSLEKKEEELDRKNEEVEDISSALYKRSRGGFIEFLLSNAHGEGFLKNIIFKRFTIFQYVEELKGLSQEYAELKQDGLDLESEKKGLDEERKGLKEAKEDLEKERAQLQSEVANRNSLVSKLGGQISLLKDEISQLQAAILVAKSGGSYISAGDVPSGGSGGVSDFNSSAPSGSFGVFSIGAFTHRNGMSQWGARARADAGQTYLEIIDAYYPQFTLKTNYSEPSTIKVKGSGTSCYCQQKNPDGSCKSYAKEYNETIPFATYMNRIYEMPGNWDADALKVQAIAARSYAIYKVNTQGYIIPNQNNQVSKDCDNVSGWKNAVSSTSRMVFTSGGSPAVAQYAAVHGGWVNGVGWDTTNGNGGQSGWTANAWDSRSGVSWFYKSWEVYSPGMGTCGAHPKPWLTNEEMADIINTWLALKGNGVKSSFDSSRILPVTLSSCPLSGYSGSPYSMSALRSQLENPVTSVSGVAVTASTSQGSTISITFTTNRGALTIPASEFHEAYNSRAPGYLSIPQNGFTHLDVRKK